MNIANARLRYTQIFLTSLLVISLFIMNSSMSNGISQFNTNFWYRDSLIKGFTQAKLNLGDSVFSQGLVSKKGWLEYTGDQNLDDYQNARPISPEALQLLQARINKLYNVLNKRKITLMIVIPPNKASIYPDKLPDEIQKLNPKSNLDIFVDYMKKKGPPVLLDLRPALQNGQKKQAIYYNTDTHWNAYGAFIAYTEIMKTLSKIYPTLAPKTLKDFDIQNVEPHLHDIPQLIGATNILEADVRFIPIQNNRIKWATLNHDNIVPMQVSTVPNKSLPKLIMYMDSFGIGLKNFIAVHFQQATFIQNSTKYTGAISLKKIDEVKPNIIIIEMVERSFSNRNLNTLLQQLLVEKIEPGTNPNATP